jgi:hypothetical protein
MRKRILPKVNKLSIWHKYFFRKLRRVHLKILISKNYFKGDDNE